MEKYRKESSLSDEYLELLIKHTLFSGLDKNQISRFIAFAKPYLIELEQGQAARLTGGLSNHLGAVFSGEVIVYGIDYSGNRLLHNHIGSNQTSGTLFSILDYINTQVEVEAKEQAVMLMINRDAIYQVNEALAVIQHRLLVNMIESQRSMFRDLSLHLYCLCQRSIRDKILKILYFFAEQNRSYEFDIPFSREDLANYLAVDRASLSRSLGELKAQGIIDFKKNHFKVLSTQYFQYD
ncbi:MAG TPA: hypothetical protein DEO32_01580 [Ruminococcaceae bacterium]|nr:hypothetical protein [Oscillospiraceae bacterium]